VTARARAVVLVWIVFLAACAVLASRARFATDLSAFLPAAPTPAQRVLVDQLREGVVSQLLLIGLEGAAADRLAGLSTGLAQQLAAAPEFAYASNGAEESVRADAQFLLTHRYLLSPGVSAGRRSRRRASRLPIQGNRRPNTPSTQGQRAH